LPEFRLTAGDFPKRNYFGANERGDFPKRKYFEANERGDFPKRNYFGANERADFPKRNYFGANERGDFPKRNYFGANERGDFPKRKYFGANERGDFPKRKYFEANERGDFPKRNYFGANERTNCGRFAQFVRPIYPKIGMPPIKDDPVANPKPCLAASAILLPPSALAKNISNNANTLEAVNPITTTSSKFNRFLEMMKATTPTTTPSIRYLIANLIISGKVFICL